MTKTLEGHLERIVYHNEDNHYTVAKLKVRGNPELVTVVGQLTGITLGEVLRLWGDWETHPKYGQQFKATGYRVSLPAQIHGIQKYLGSGLIKGIGPEMAKRLVERFGTKTLEVIEHSPDDLLGVKGIGEKRLQMILKAWEGQREIRDVMIFLQGHGVSTGYSAKIFKQYGHDAIRVVRENPYRLASDIFGIGFLIADRIAEKVGIAKDAMIRAEAGIIHVLEKMSNEGHMFVLYDQLQDRAETLLEIDRTVLETAVENLAASGRIVLEDFHLENDPSKAMTAVYLKTFYAAEVGLANRLKALFSVPVKALGMDAGRIERLIQYRLAIMLAKEQWFGLHTALSHKVSIITGGPGTGKTTLVKAILAVFEAAGKQVVLCAPTGRAAKRLSEVTGHEAKTIHRLLVYNFKSGGFQKNEKDPLDADVVIVDEASMVDTFLMYHLVKAVPMTAVLILVGDVYQLPSVGPGNVLRDMIDSNQVAVVFLKEIFRQAQKSLIIVNAHRINQGFPPTMPDSNRDTLEDFYFIEQEDPEKVLSIILELCCERIPGRFKLDPLSDIQVLSPMHKGIVGTTNLNRVLQQALNPSNDTIERMGRTFKCRDKVMQVRNNYGKEVFNGDIGTISRIDRDMQKITVEYDGRAVDYEFGELDELVLAYAVSVHKSQGSEYRAVILPVMIQHFMLLQRNLVYTGVTRAKELVVLIGTKQALAIALRNDTPKKRMTRLCERMQ
ncbi:MAG: ATP-dependent RecD-like DNA helicase [Deltaproteobacteria bacterium]|nr:ATP-dependent RecD-like DNA helicase [Deltaproteobacteria bacterium]MBW2018629.1 ATP-dependent RecD-like DNA helicase [Deltaproteobacteria bacterium]MBW2073895.1 ATP-dependent RecD-like DNA helicase [Deltaproteobacteria bacterium]RLB81862.1 MAG: ATP-dependent RecD-like DNA helicase [Deltaproteobacteria bacterium]